MSTILPIQEEEKGSETIEFLALVPLLLLVGLVIVQLFLAGQTILLTVGASREGVRAAAACGDIGSAVANAIGGLSYSVSGGTGSDESVVTVSAQVPGVLGPLVSGVMPTISFTSRMATEKTRCGY